MKKILTLFILFTIAYSAFAAPRTGYYQSGQTKISIFRATKQYEKDMVAYNYKMTPLNFITTTDYTQTWSYTYKENSNVATLRFQFFDDRVVVTMLDAVFISKNGTRYNMEADDAGPEMKKLYASLENMMITVYFKYLEVSETKSEAANSVSPISSESTSYDFVTANYLATSNKDEAKKNAKEYENSVLKVVFQVTNLQGSASADYQEIKYVVDDNDGVSTAIVTYDFRNKDFTIKIKSIDYYNKNNKTNIKVSKDSKHDTVLKFYSTYKLYFLDKQAQFIKDKTQN